MHTAYPTTLDAATYLDSLNLLRVTPGLLLSLDLASKVAASAARWEKESLWTPYLSSGNAEDRFFDPPSDTRFIQLGAGLLSASALTTGWTGVDGSGFAQTLGLGYRLLPQNAPAQGRAYETLEFLSSGYSAVGGIGYPFGSFGLGYGFNPLGQVGSIKLSGIWGRVAAPPDDVWQAILENAIRLCIPALHRALTNGLIEWSQAGVSKTYRDKPLEYIQECLSTDWDAVSAMHRRVLTYI